MSQNKLMDYLNSFLRDEDDLVFFDIGSCDGEDSIKYSKAFKKAKIYCFEPILSNYKMLLKNIENNNAALLFPYNMALSDKIMATDIFLSSVNKDKLPDHLKDIPLHLLGNKSNSLLPPEDHKTYFPWIEFSSKENIQTTTLDFFCKENEINIIDFMHIDVQGAELLVLNGGRKMLDKTNLIWLEVSQVHYYKNQPIKKDIEIFMKKNNFRLLHDAVNFPHGDQLYVSKIFYKKNRYRYLWKKWKNYLLFF